MTEYRCKGKLKNGKDCHKLLFKYSGEFYSGIHTKIKPTSFCFKNVTIEIVCPKCHIMNKILLDYIFSECIDKIFAEAFSNAPKQLETSIF